MLEDQNAGSSSKAIHTVKKNLNQVLQKQA